MHLIPQDKVVLIKKLSIAILIPFKIHQNSIKLWVQTRESHDELKGLLEFPGGKVELGESILSASLREVHEETGIILKKDDLRFFKTYSVFKKVLISVYLFNDSASLFNINSYKDLSYLQSNLSQLPPNNEVILTDLYEYFQGFILSTDT